MQQRNGCFEKTLSFFWKCGHPNVDATAQQGFSEGPYENLRRVRGGCNSGTEVFEKTPSFFLDKAATTVDATAQQAFSKGPSEYSRRVGSGCNSGTDVFEKTP